MIRESDGSPTGNAGRRGSRHRRRLLLAVLTLALTACGTGSGSRSGTAAQPSAQKMTLYTCLSDTSIQPVITAFEKSEPGSTVNLFRAPTGQLNARIAADTRSGGLKADVVWGCDPLTVQALVDQHLVGGWIPADAAAIPPAYRTADYVGAHLLYMVAVYRTDLPAPRAWSDLAGPGYRTVAVPDPAVAASALGALGYFAANTDYGVGFYAKLRSRGAVQVSTPDAVTTGVAQGVYAAGLTTSNSAYAAKKDGSPVDVVWPEPGAVAIYGPVALATHSAHAKLAKDFIGFVIGDAGQRVLGASGTYPTRPGVAGPTVPAGAPVVHPDWAAIASTRTTIRAQYAQAFGR